MSLTVDFGRNLIVDDHENLVKPNANPRRSGLAQPSLAWPSPARPSPDKTTNDEELIQGI